ncbi:hypothetical protein AVEN_266353-1 [Araneus ventricosus]|uniref:Uncharacterized protein n=1 Tax=Araneus ventricosus TaxID=182803 RepID=A0A4Y2CRV0_ARAVE|nr:hypothetical protein AVEN_266353-1 [Araneus ventricosus]
MIIELSHQAIHHTCIILQNLFPSVKRLAHGGRRRARSLPPRLSTHAFPLSEGSGQYSPLHQDSGKSTRIKQIVVKPIPLASHQFPSLSRSGNDWAHILSR